MQQYVEGQTRRNKRTGEVQVFSGGQWQPQGSAPGMGPQIRLGSPRTPPPQTETQAAIDSANLSRIQNDVATAPMQRDLLAAQTEKARIEASKAGQPTDDQQKLAQKRANLDSLVAQINRVEELYQQNIAPTDGIEGVRDLLPTPANRQFNAAGAGMAEQGLAAFRVPGVGSQSDAELRQFVEANRPNASNFDTTIEEKLRQLRGRVDATRAELGLPPAEWDKSTVHTAGPSGGGQREIATGPTRRGINPADAGINARVNAMLKRGSSDRQIIGYLKEVGADPDKDPRLGVSLGRALDWRRKNPKYRGDWKVDLEREVELQNDVISQLGGGPTGAYFANAADTLTLGNLDSMTPNPALTRAGMEGLRQQNPLSSLAGTVTGGAAMAGGAELAAARMGLQAARAALAGDAAFGAGYGAGAADDGSRLGGAVSGALAGGIGGEAGRRVASGTGRAFTGARDEGTRMLADKGVRLSVGQIAGKGGVVGRTVKGIEDKLESLPLLGDAIRRRRAQGYQDFNRAAFREALEPIAAKAPDQIGEAGVEYAKDSVSDSYSSALRGVRVPADRGFISDMKSAMSSGSKLHPDTAEDFARLVQNEVAEELADGTLTGEGYQALRRIIREERAAWRGRPRGAQYGKALRQLESGLERLVRRKAPGVVDALNQSDASWRRVKVLQDAVSRAKNGQDGGIFTPAQLGTSATTSARKYGGSQGTTGQPFFDLQRAGQETLPSSVPNSGTADRAIGSLLLPVGLGGAGSYAGLPPEQVALMASLGLPYTSAGQAALQTLLVTRPDVMRRLGEQVLKRKRVGGLFGAGAGLGALPAE